MQYQSIELCWYQGIKPDPHLKTLSSNFFWMGHCDVAETMNDFLGIFPLTVFKLGQQVFVDVPLRNFAYFANFPF